MPFRATMLRSLPLLAAVALAACGPLSIATTGRDGVATEGVVGRTGSTPGKTLVLPSPVSGVLSRPQSLPTPTASATPEPAPTPLPSPPLKLEPKHEAIKNTLSSHLASLAKLGFTQSQATLLSNNSAGVIANGSAGVISNNSAGLISDNGLGLISDNGLGYRIAQAADVITVGPLPGEVLASEYLWPDGERMRQYYDPTTYATDKRVRTAWVNLAGHGFYEMISITKEAYPSGFAKKLEEISTRANAQGGFMFSGDMVSDISPALVADACSLGDKGFRWDDAFSGVKIDVPAFSLDYATDAGSYEMRFPTWNLVEKGTLSKLRRNPDGVILLDLMQLEQQGDVDATLSKSDGTVFYHKMVQMQGDKQVYTYELRDKLALRFDAKRGSDLVGKLMVDGVAEADAVLERRTAGITFVITFPEDKEHPIVVGYGAKGSPPSTENKGPSWSVSTVAGSASAGTTDGRGDAASFKSLRGIAASRTTPGRLYVSDMDAHNIRRVDIGADGKATVATVAGTGTAGLAQGPGAQAAFNQPADIAVAPDDTLYVADTLNHIIRKITPDGTVSTYAGTGNIGSDDGVLNTATFDQPRGLALADDGTLYVSDAARHVIRAIAPDGRVSTFAGKAGTGGFADGPAADARFTWPTDIALAKDGRMLVADASNYALRQIAPDGTVSTLAGTGKWEPTKRNFDGPARDVCLKLAYLALGPTTDTPYLSITDANVRMFRADGQIGSYAGLFGPLHSDSLYFNAGFTAIRGLAFGSDGRLYACDGTRLRVVTGNKYAPAP